MEIGGSGFSKKTINVSSELAQKIKLLENELATKNHFLACTSHELRASLNGILGYTNLMLMQILGSLTEEQKENLKIIQASAKHLLSLSNDLLDILKIQLGKWELKRKRIHCQRVVQTAATMLAPLAAEKRLTLKINLPEVPIYILTDARALTQILLNLINNAIKFTEKGYVIVSLKNKKIEGKDGVAIIVTDSGIGVKSQDQKKLFQAFGKINSSRNEGTGLGLYLSQQLALQMKSKIEFITQPGKGSQFYLTLPKAIVKNKIIAAVN